MNILAMDPGSQTTGFFVYSDSGVRHRQVSPDEAISTLGGWHYYDAYVVEKYRPKGTSDPLPAELNGAARMRAYLEETEFVEVTPAQAKTMAPDHLLKALEWYDPELPHANDAARLVVCFAITKLPRGDLHDYVVNTKLAVRL